MLKILILSLNILYSKKLIIKHFNLTYKVIIMKNVKHKEVKIV